MSFYWRSELQPVSRHSTMPLNLALRASQDVIRRSQARIALDMWVIFGTFRRAVWPAIEKMEGPHAAGRSCLGTCRCTAAAAGWLGVPLLDEYLEFVAGRCRPNTVLATAFDLKVFFAVVDKPPAEVSAATCWLHHRAAHWGDGRRLRAVDEQAGLSSRTVRRRLLGVGAVRLSAGPR